MDACMDASTLSELSQNHLNQCQFLPLGHVINLDKSFLPTLLHSRLIFQLYYLFTFLPLVNSIMTPIVSAPRSRTTKSADHRSA